MKLALVTLLAAMLALPFAAAVGMVVPNNLSNVQQVRMGSDRSIDVLIKGDGQAHNIRFFANVNSTAMQINGKQNYSFSYVLAAGESKTFSMNLHGVGPATNVLTEYGFEHTPVSNASNNSIPMVQVARKTFTTNVLCPVGGCPSNPSPPASPKKSSGGGGSGGVKLPVVKANASQNASSPPVETPQVPAISTVPPIVDESNLSTTPVATDVIVPDLQNPPPVVGSPNTTGKTALLVTMSLLICALIVNLVVVHYIKGVDL